MRLAITAVWLIKRATCCYEAAWCTAALIVFLEVSAPAWAPAKKDLPEPPKFDPSLLTLDLIVSSKECELQCAVDGPHKSMATPSADHEAVLGLVGEAYSSTGRMDPLPLHNKILTNRASRH
jgi:hypothetical protein